MARTKSEDAAYHKTQWRERKAQGLCVACGKAPAGPERSMCPVCLGHRRLYEARWQLRRRKRLKGEGRCQQCRSKILSKRRTHYCGRCRAKRLELYRTRHRDKRLQAHRTAHQALKVATFEAYGGCLCACCGETHMEFLSIDHIHGGGRQDRIKRGFNLYGRLKRDGFPQGFRVLCMNCNFAIGHFGKCPHEAT